MFEKKKDYVNALDQYNSCINICNLSESSNRSATISSSSSANKNDSSKHDEASSIYSDLKGDAMLRIAILHKETGLLDQAMLDCTHIAQEGFSLTIRANALCLKGLLHELKLEYPASEVVYRSALQLLPGHTLALERLGRVYLRYRETIPAAVQCFIKVITTVSCLLQHISIAYYFFGCISIVGGSRPIRPYCMVPARPMLHGYSAVLGRVGGLQSCSES